MNVMLLAATVLVAWSTMLTAPDAGEDPVQAGRDAFAARRGMPWYDQHEDALQPVEVQPYQDDDRRLSDWSSTKQPQQQNLGWLTRILLSILKVLAWVGLGVVAALVIWALIWALKRAERNRSAHVAVTQENSTINHRLEDLPMPIQPQHTDLLAAAKAYLAQGDLGKAIIYAFAHQLVQLDKHHLIQLTKGKTNRQYLRELKPHPEFQDLLCPTMFAFEDVFFGHHEMTRQRFDDCWQSLERFHQRLEQAAT